MTDKTKKTILLVISLFALWGAFQTAPHPEYITFRIQFSHTPTHKDTLKMPFGIDEILSGLFGTGMGLLTQKFSADQDFQNQMRLMQEQQRMSQENALYNQGLAMQTWRDTNYPAQVEQMRKAGLNVGLMYKQGGPGGQLGSQGGNQPTISAPPKMDAGLAMQLGLQTARAQAEIDNIKADTELKKQEAPKTQAQTSNITADTQNIQLDSQLKDLDIFLKRITTDIAEATKPDAIQEIKSRAAKLTTDAHTAAIENRVAKETADEKINQVILATTEAGLRIGLQKSNLIKIGAETEQVNASIKEIAARINNMTVTQKQRWVEMDGYQKEVAIKSFLADLEKQQILFNTSTPQQIKQWLNALMGGAEIAGQMRGKPLK